MLLWESKFATAEIVEIRNGQLNTFGGTIYFTIDDTSESTFYMQLFIVQYFCYTSTSHGGNNAMDSV